MPTYVTTITFRGTTTLALCAANHNEALDQVIADISPAQLIAPGALVSLDYAKIIVDPLLLPDIFSDYDLQGDLPFTPWPTNVPQTVAGYFSILDNDAIPIGSLLYQQRAEELGQQLLFLPVDSQAN